MLILLLQACTHTPATLYPEPFPRLDLTVPPIEGTVPVDLGAGEPAPYVGVLLDDEELVRLKTRSQLLEVHDREILACYAGREGDRVRGQEAFSLTSHGEHAALRRESALRVAVPVAGVGGVALGLGLGVAQTWANSRAIGVGVGGAL